MKSKSRLFSFLIFSGVLICSFLTFNSCQESDEVKFKKSMSNGKYLYQNRCQHCHGNKGQGLGKLYPPLDSSDYLVEKSNLIPCIISNGQAGKIVVNGIEYNQVMPSNPKLLDDEIAELITYIGNAWGNNKIGLIGKEFVEQSLSDCPEVSLD
jgi:mono/diheme cytochrome c family protein